MSNEKTISNMKLSPYPDGYKAAVTISFDYETDIISSPMTITTKIKKTVLRFTNSLGITDRKISTENYRNGALLSFEYLKKYQLHATWFGIGHTLLKDNFGKNAYRINQILKYTTKETPYRNSYLTFFNEPFSDYKKYPHYYLGDITRKFYNNGEDIQSHSFSHPFMALEPDDNIKLDIEDWQNSALILGVEKAKIFAFPFLSDCYYFYPELNEKNCNRWDNKGKEEIIPIDIQKLKILYLNGIRLVTRSEYYSYEKPFKGIKKYLDSDLYYVYSRGINLTKLTKESLTAYLNKIIENEWTVDFWCHNWDVAENPEKFELFLSILDKYRNNIWIPTLKEFWEYQERLIINHSNNF